MAAVGAPERVRTAIIGGGPASLLLSYILHGHIPYYKGGHPDALLDAKFRRQPNLLQVEANVDDHMAADLRYAYSSSALPINALLDTLVRPNGNVDLDAQSCIEWRCEPHAASSHLVLASTAQAGGQWAQSEGDGVDKTSVLSYAEYLSLPGYSFDDHLAREALAGCVSSDMNLGRPSRRLVGSYFAEYPIAVGIKKSLRVNQRVESVVREAKGGFRLMPVNVWCEKLVLATGAFESLIPPPSPLSMAQSCFANDMPLLVVGSGFSAADVILASAPTRCIVHMFNWNPKTTPSPLKACHMDAYPEYVTLYRQMKLAASQPAKHRAGGQAKAGSRHHARWRSRDWAQTYIGLANASIDHVTQDGDGRAADVHMRLENGSKCEFAIGEMKYLIGRRASLNYLDPLLANEILPDASLSSMISTKTLRLKAEVNNMEVASDVFVIGSLSGDSLVRHCFGSTVQAAGHILSAAANMQTLV